jgi:hypothetical protein
LGPLDFSDIDMYFIIKGGLFMKNKTMAAIITTGILMTALFTIPQSSYADWGVGVSVGGPGFHHDDHGFYRWHDHPHWGYHYHFLPAGYLTIRVGWHSYYYYNGLYYSYVNGDYVLVSPPIGAYVSAIPPDFQPVIINGRTYYTDNGVYYLLTRHRGYKVVVAPVVYAQPVTTVVAAPAAADQNIFPINVPNNSGGYVTVVVKRSGNGYVGPQGEFYAQFPSVTQLKAMYVK